MTNNVTRILNAIERLRESQTEDPVAESGSAVMRQPVQIGKHMAIITISFVEIDVLSEFNSE